MIIKQTRNTLSKTYIDAVKIRHKVFVKEQGVPTTLEIDKNEALCLHFTVYHDKGKACATCRLLPNKSYKIATLQRMAVLKDYRGNQIGQTLMTYILDYASIQGFEKIELHAQLSAVDFYSKLGFQTIGDHFMEAGIEHVTMEKVLMQP
ncbi:GNAT family N-acetyltransferase [Streptococcus uberis]|uniref:GNAT family N-acetyltransferase n=1 Tax=Streptococcus uberis TaxID=1349 RepID=UPI0006202AED|nr:GNAT family N-acetyltransferase [Streptococcus uberis]AUC25626.1 N-acetyltransferase [Streptococcus uberis]KKF40301.1 GNAT family acetyltransferase [Streptococcus uberis Ab71]KKF40702.1 GNAT family acetyltransferase [Streptococcus uberis C9359]KKF51557.1 GNAT family acetyltransferase [Streptococcus uberis C5388]KKF51996.1 GNAT family acetyltransferase [Streptococcus uberis B190]